MEAKAGLDRMYGALRAAPPGAAADGALPGPVRAALEDDLNTPRRWRTCTTWRPG